MSKPKNQKQPISYYGGKQQMVKHILPNIPEHRIYTEAFFGGGSVFWAKEPAESEIINDKNNLIINFYEQIKTNFSDLKEKVESTLFSRASYKVAMVIWQMPHLFDPLQQAWAVYVGCNQGFASQIGSWGFDKYGKSLKAFNNKKMRFNPGLVERLQNATIESNPACKVIATYDAPDAFHYCDPPYVNTAQAHYKGYDTADYLHLLDTLSKIKGKFLLSSFPNKLLTEFTKKNSWHTLEIKKAASAAKATAGKARGTTKTEVLTANYPLCENGL
jgi:DNA adenine methylase